MTQLHDAINKFFPLSELKKIIETNPFPVELFKRDEINGCTPFEICTFNKDHDNEVLIYILQASPKKVSTNMYAKYLSWSIEENRSPQLMKAIVECDPSCIYFKDDDGTCNNFNSICHVMFRYYHLVRNLSKTKASAKEVLKREIFDFVAYDGSILTIQYIVDVIEVMLRAASSSKKRGEWNILQAAIENEYCQ